MNRRRWLASAGALLLAGGATPGLAAAAEPHVELELVTTPGFPLTGAQRWIREFEGIGVANVRIRGGREGDRPVVERTPSPRGESIRVVGVLTTQNTLQLPGGTFRQGDRGGLSAWLARLKQGDAPAAEQPAAFGLSAAELVALHETLGRATLVQPTRERRPAEIAGEIARLLPLRVDLDAAAQAALATAEPFPDELRGLSAGTALAAVVRPAGLVVTPEKSAGRVGLRIADVRAVERSWPIGWPLEKPEAETAPDLFKFLTVEIVDTPVGETVGAIAERLGLPVLYDHNGLVRSRTDIGQAKASFPEGRTYYKRILSHVLFQANLKEELRIDEAGRPLLWISSTKR